MSGRCHTELGGDNPQPFHLPQDEALWGTPSPSNMCPCPLIFLEFSTWIQNALCSLTRSAGTSCKSQAPLGCVSLSLQASLRAISPYPTSLHLFKPFAEVIDGVFNSLWSTLFSLSCHLTSFYLLPASGVKLHPPGIFPFHLYIKLHLSQSSSITLLLKSPG